jgi:hypothetical protein
LLRRVESEVEAPLPPEPDKSKDAEQAKPQE